MNRNQRTLLNDGAPSDGEEPTSHRGLSLVLLSGGVGALAGLVGGVFHHLLESAGSARVALTEFLHTQPFPGWLVTTLICALTVTLAIWMVARFAPEASGSGIHEVEGILADERLLRWRRVLPVKFFGGLLAIGSGLDLGREGPTVHMGGAIGGFVAESLEQPEDCTKTLVAAGAGAGLAAAFNAPLAGIIFVTEEMRSEFKYHFISLYSVIAASCMAVVVNDWWLGQGPDLPIRNVPLAPLREAPLFLVLGVLIGVIGVGFNWVLLRAVRSMGRIRRRHSLMMGVTIGSISGALLWFLPEAMGGGETLVETLVAEKWTVVLLLGLFAIRFVTTVGSYGSGAPGGIFAPLLGLGTIAGVAFGSAVTLVFPGIVSTPGAFAVAAMGALFAATVGAPLTGIILVVELTNAHSALLTIILTCLSASLTAKSLGGTPIYTQLLQVALSSSPEISKSPKET
ncbi:MAG: H(+)/Cl(-) exchange transporter ClcA [Candidatus Omnitrophica bacterium]|nr:H(+)/Cl(-) exchange transporter ClcA [Candidatus Omnitrophota bacterium]